MLTKVRNAVRHTRQHHAIEHATLHMLAARFPSRRMVGYSDPGGFTIVGDLTDENVRRAVADAMLRLQSGESALAIHPNCGTNLAVTALLVSGAALLGGARRRDPTMRFAGALLFVVPMLILSQGLGLRLQQVTTLANVTDRWLKEIRSWKLGQIQLFRVQVANRLILVAVTTMIHLLLNTDEYLATEYIAGLRATLGDPEMAGLNTVEMTGSQVDAASILAEISTMPFLSAKRLVLVRGYLEHLDKRMAASKSTASAAHTEAARLLEGLAEVPETGELVLVDNAVDKRRGLWKGFMLPAGQTQPEHRVLGLEAQSKAGTISIAQLSTPDARNLSGWIAQHARHRSIAVDGAAIAVLADFVGPNLRQLDNELEKLSLYAHGRAITADDVRALVSDASEEMIWNLTDALGQRNGRNAMRALRELRRNDQSPIGLVGLIARQYRLLIKVKTAMQGARGDEFAIAKQIGEKPFPVKKASAAGRSLLVCRPGSGDGPPAGGRYGHERQGRTQTRNWMYCSSN